MSDEAAACAPEALGGVDAPRPIRPAAFAERAAGELDTPLATRSAGPSGPVQIRLLGPVDVTVAGTARQVSGSRRKAVLATLALSPRRIVSTDHLIEVVWGDRAPATAVNSLQSHLSYLRRVLGGRSTIVARSPGYVLELPAEATDVEVAERLLREGRETPDPTRRATCLRSAVALWRDRPLVDVDTTPWLHDHADRLAQLEHEAVRGLIDARLALGEHARLVPELEQLTQQHPLDEQVHAQLILSYYRAGRQGDALATCRRLRRTLGDELAIDCSPAVRDLEAAVLRQDPAIDLPEPQVSVRPPAAATPAQLPPALATFAGREAELGRMDDLLPEEELTSGPGVISVLSGTAGVGKTTLALHWAHRVAARFPDGQLYVNLLGFDPAQRVIKPTDAVRGLLTGLGVPADRIPLDAEARTGLYRSMLAGKRVLVVLDNAHDAEQVRPLLPASSGCLVLVTSRNQLAPLVAAEGAHPIVVGLPAPTEARTLLAGRLGESRLAAEPGAVAEIIARCARLPLALSIVAARAATQPAFRLAALAAQLRETDGVLDAFHGGDPATDVRSMFSWSYRALSADAARVFRLVGLHPGPDLSTAAAASLAGLPPQRVRPLLTELTRAHLLIESIPGRFGCHDLLHAYASEQAIACEDRHQQEAALQRLLDHYLHTAHAADLLLHPLRSHRLTLTAVRTGVTVEEPADLEQALAWFTAERSALVAVIKLAAGNDSLTGAAQLARTMSTFLERQGHWDELAETQRTALGAAGRLADRSAQALAHCGLAGAEVRLRRFDEAYDHLRAARDLFDSVGDKSGRAQIHLDLGWLFERQNRYADALSHAERALDLFRSTGHRDGQARALNQVGWCHAQLDGHHLTLARCRQALALHQDLGNRAGEAHTWDSLGHAHHHLGSPRRAVACYQRAVDLFHVLGDRYNESEALSHLGDVHQGSGDSAAARVAWGRAQAIRDELSHPSTGHPRVGLEPAEPVGGRIS